jgi:1-deoxy-D-xylulose-5-phosphate synthase
MIADAARHDMVITCEDGLRDGGIGAAIVEAVRGISPTTRTISLGVPTRFVPQAKPGAILSRLGLDAEGIAAEATRLLKG